MITLEWLLATAIGTVMGVGVYLLFIPRTFAAALGLGLISYAVNFFIFAAGALWIGTPPILGTTPIVADPLPQALILTAIVIGFATTAYLLALAVRAYHANGDDTTALESPARRL